MGMNLQNDYTNIFFMKNVLSIKEFNIRSHFECMERMPEPKLAYLSIPKDVRFCKLSALDWEKEKQLLSSSLAHAGSGVWITRACSTGKLPSDRQGVASRRGAWLGRCGVTCQISWYAGRLNNPASLILKPEARLVRNLVDCVR